MVNKKEIAIKLFGTWSATWFLLAGPIAPNFLIAQAAGALKSRAPYIPYVAVKLS